MNSREVAKWLSTECTDEEYAEVFAYLYYEMKSGGRHFPDSLTSEMMKEVNVDAVVKQTGNALKEILFSTEMDVSAWWK